MKKLLILLILLILPVAASAVPDTPYDPATILRWSELTPRQQQLVDLIYPYVAHHSTEAIGLPENTSYEDAKAAVILLQEDLPELAALDSILISYYSRTPGIAVSVTPSYLCSAQEAGQLEEQLMTLARQIVSGAPRDPFECELYLNDYLCGTVTYTDGGAWQYSAWGALGQRACVCEGYAMAMTLLMRLSGIPCSKISGMADAKDGKGYQPHAWNAMLIGGEICLTDVTWNSSMREYPGCYPYLNLSAADFGRSHYANDGFTLTAASTGSQEYYLRKGLIFSDAGAAAAYVNRYFCVDSGCCSFRMTDQSAAEAVIAMLRDASLFDVNTVGAGAFSFWQEGTMIGIEFTR